MKYAILADAACDVEPVVLKKPEVGIIPMEIMQGDRTSKYIPVASSETVKAFYAAQRCGEFAKTSKISPYDYEAAMRPWLDKGYSLIYLALSDGLSSTCQTAELVAKALEEEYPGQSVAVIDTKSATGGMGILLERAMRNREAGMSLSENKQNLIDAIKHIHHWFLVQDLDYLKKGGRISAATAAVGSALHIRPILQIDQYGKLVTIARAHGTHKAVNDLLERYKKYREGGNADPVYVLDADAPEIGDMLEEKLLALEPCLTVRRCTLSPIIGAHTGPGMAAIVHIGR